MELLLLVIGVIGIAVVLVGFLGKAVCDKDKLTKIEEQINKGS